MSKLFKLISTIIITISIVIGGGINLNLSNINIQAKKAETTTTKKNLKKKLSLDYTHPKFETDLNQDQKNAILKSLKKWKGELPIDNRFTITSIADLKSETNDDNKVSKKKNKNISNAKVIYMWSQTANPNYDPKNPIETEEGDPRYIRTQFNILLKQNQKGNWKASIERDPEVQIDSTDIIETDLDTQIYKDLFATDKADNGFTAAEEVLVEDINTAPETVPLPANTPVILPTTSISSSTVSSQTVPVISTTESTPIPVVTDKISWLQSIIGFGAISANAQVTDQYNYSWPWKGGEQYQVIQGWHECETADKNVISKWLGPSSTGCSIDVRPVDPTSNNEVLAPITTTITRSCIDTMSSIYQFGSMTIGHLDRNTTIMDTGVYVRKGQKIGNIWIPINPETGTEGFSDGCGPSATKHLHIKLAGVTNPNPYVECNIRLICTTNYKKQSLVGSVTIDGKTLYGPKITPIRSDFEQNYNPYLNADNKFSVESSTVLTSQNYPNTNTYAGKIKSLNTPNKIFDIYDFNGNNGAILQLYEAGTNNPVNQRWTFDSTTKQIKGMNAKCLDVGYLTTTSANAKGLRMQDCTSSNNQKWTFDQTNKQISSIANTNNCIEAIDGIQNGSILAINPCNITNNNQKWNFSDIVNIIPKINLDLKVNLSGAISTSTGYMTTLLNTSNVIPLNQPYCKAPWNYCGSEYIPDRANIDQTAVDWVLLEIKNSAGTTVQKKAALVTKNGYLTDPLYAYKSGYYFPIEINNITSAGSYKVIVRHRNHIAIATNTNITLTPGSTTTIDFTKNANVLSLNQKLLGTNTSGQNIYGLYPGDINSDGVAGDAIDRSLMRNSAESGGVYNILDANLDSNIDAIDRSLIRNATEVIEAI